MSSRAELEKSIQDLINKTSFHVGDLNIVEDADTGMIWFSISSNEPHYFIGRNGENLQAINHLVRKMIEKSLTGTETFTDIVVDVNDFQKKRVDNLKTVAHMMAERARFFKSSVDVEPMSSYDRKIVHSYLSNKNDVSTESVGEGANRHIVIKFVGQ
jgi:spoIIIJ-associated protein